MVTTLPSASDSVPAAQEHRSVRGRVVRWVSWMVLLVCVDPCHAGMLVLNTNARRPSGGVAKSGLRAPCVRTVQSGRTSGDSPWPTQV